MPLAKRLSTIVLTILLGLSTTLPIFTPVSATAASDNLIANSSVETADPSNGLLPQAWQEGGWGSNQASYSYLNTGQDGARSVSVHVSNYTNGDAKWYFNPVSVQPGSQYNFSDYYKSDVQTDMVAQFEDSSGNYTYQDLGTASASTDWKQYTANFTAPASAVHVTIFHVINSVGTLTTDNFSLTGASPVTPPEPPVTPPEPPATPPSTGNLIANSSVETADPSNSAMPQGWNKDKWGTNTATYSYLANGHDSGHSVRVDMSSYTSGDAKWYFDPVAVEAGTGYGFSDYYKSDVQTDVVAQFDNGSGNYTYQDLGTAPASTDWKQYTASFTVPGNAAKVTVFHVINSIGSLTTDDFSLTKASDPTPPTPPPADGDNLIANPSAETADPANSAMPQYWLHDGWGTNDASYSYLNDGYDGSRSMQVQLSNYVSGDAKWYFNPVSVQLGSQYSFSDYYKSTTPTEVDAVFTMSDGSTTYQIIGQPDASSSWHKFDTNFSIPSGAVNMTVYHFIKQNGTLTTDDYSLTPYTPSGFNRALVSLTFDDGYASTYDNGLPVLQKYGFVSTQFIISGLVGQPKYMTRAEVKAWHAKGHEVASHTVTHPDLTQDNAKQLKTELTKSQSALQNWIGAPVTDFAYPYGLYNDAVLDATSQHYSAARGVEEGFNGKDNFDPYDIRVQNISDTTTAAQVADWVAEAQSTDTWLVLVYHSVDPNSADSYDPAGNVTPAELDAQLASIKSSGITVETMQQAFTEVKSQL